MKQKSGKDVARHDFKQLRPENVAPGSVFSLRNSLNSPELSQSGSCWFRSSNVESLWCLQGEGIPFSGLLATCKDKTPLLGGLTIAHWRTLAPCTQCHLGWRDALGRLRNTAGSLPPVGGLGEGKPRKPYCGGPVGLLSPFKM